MEPEALVLSRRAVIALPSGDLSGGAGLPSRIARNENSRKLANFSYFGISNPPVGRVYVHASRRIMPSYAAADERAIRVTR